LLNTEENLLLGYDRCLARKAAVKQEAVAILHLLGPKLSLNQKF